MAAENQEIIVVKDLWKVYPMGNQGYAALRGINLKAKAGEFIAIIGPSGCGKSTLLNIIGALDKPTKGEVWIEGTNISKLNDFELAELRNRKIGFIFQTFNLLAYMSASDNVEVPLIARGVHPSDRLSRAHELLVLVGLQGFEKNLPSMLSGGQQQRVAISRALANNPSILLADEPTGNLDSKSAAEVMEVLRKLNSDGATIIMVTHNMELTKFSNRIWFMIDGIVEKEVVRSA